jgi:hypothetical protein
MAIHMLDRHTNGYTPARSHVAFYKACVAIATEIKSEGNIFIAGGFRHTKNHCQCRSHLRISHVYKLAVYCIKLEHTALRRLSVTKYEYRTYVHTVHTLHTVQTRRHLCDTIGQFLFYLKREG